MRNLRLVVAGTVGLMAAGIGVPAAQGIQAAVEAPAHPVQLETLQTYFDEVHYGSWLRRMWSAGCVDQAKQLPPWYPPTVWEAIVKAGLNMNLVGVALPVYQKYMSEEVAQHAIKLFATDEGQKMAAQMFAKYTAQHGADSAK